MRESFSNLLQKPWVIPVGVGLVSASAGFAGGYFLGRKKGVDDFLDDVSDSLSAITYETSEELDGLQDEVAETPDIPATPEDWEVDETPVEPILVDGKTFTDYTNIIDDAGYSGEETEDTEMDDSTAVVDEEPPAPEPVRVHIFEPPENVPEWNYDKELAKREKDEDAPCVIHTDEFVRNDLGLMQETLTYYAGDDIVTDPNDTVVYNPERLLGNFKENFGYGSNDRNVVYIRNIAMRREWEILLHTGSFSTEVLGLEIEEEYEESDLRHSADRRFRDRD